MKYAFIHAELGGYPLSIVCRVLGVTQAGYHARQAKVPSPRDHERDALRACIRSVFEAQRGRYGAPRLYQVLRTQHSYTGSLNRIYGRAKAGSMFAVCWTGLPGASLAGQLSHT